MEIGDDNGQEDPEEAAAARRELIEMFREGAFADLGDPEVMKAAWE